MGPLASLVSELTACANPNPRVSKTPCPSNTRTSWKSAPASAMADVAALIPDDPVSALARGFKSYSEQPQQASDADAGGTSRPALKRRRRGTVTNADSFIVHSDSDCPSSPSSSRARKGPRPAASARRGSDRRKDSAVQSEWFWTDVRGRPGVIDGCGFVKPETFPEVKVPLDLFRKVPGIRRWKRRPQAGRRVPGSTGADSSRPPSPPGRRYFRKKVSPGSHGIGDPVLVSEQQSLAAVAAAADEDFKRRSQREHSAVTGDGEALFVPVMDPNATENAPSWGAACRHARREVLHLRCQQSPQDVEAWLEFAEFQWAQLGEGAGAAPQQVKEKQRAILESALEKRPADVTLLRALERAESGAYSSRFARLESEDAAAQQLQARRARLLSCAHAEAAEEFVWSYLEASILDSQSEKGMQQAASEALGVIAARKLAAGHDGKAILAFERAELAAISALVLAETARGRADFALAVLRANASLNVFFPQSTGPDQAFREAWTHGCRLGGPGALYMLQSLRLVQGLSSGSGPSAELPPALAALGDLIEAATAAHGSDFSQPHLAQEGAGERLVKAADLSGLLSLESDRESDHGRLRKWVAEELDNRPCAPSKTTKEASFEDLAPYLVSFRTDVTKREALLRFLDALGAPTLTRHPPGTRYRVAFEDAFAPFALRPLRAVVATSDQAQSRGTPLSGGFPACAERIATATRAALQGLVAWPSDALLLETLLECVWQYGAADGKLQKKVLRASEDPRLYFTYARGMWARGKHDAARAIFLKLCTASTPCDARIAIAWWHLELRLENRRACVQNARLGVVGMPPRALRLLCALAFDDFNAAELLAEKPHATDIQCLQAVARLRRCVKSGNRNDAGGCRFLVSSHYALLVALCALEMRRSPQEAWDLLLHEWPSASSAPGAGCSKTATEEARCWSLAAGMLIDLMMLCPNSPSRLLRRMIWAALQRRPGSPWLLRALASTQLRRGAVAAMRRDLDRALQLHHPTPLAGGPGATCSVRALQVAMEAELAACELQSDCDAVARSHNRLVALCERACAILGHSPFAGVTAWALHHAALLMRARARHGFRGAHHSAGVESEERWRAAVRGVRRHPRSKVLWLMQLAAWESRSQNSDEEELIDMLDAMNARGIELRSDPLEAIA